MKENTHKLSLNANELKLIAITAMLFDHIVFVITMLLPEQNVNLLYTSLLHIPGKIVAPIMCYFIAQGYYYTKSKKQYLKRLFIFAIISHFPYVLFFNCDIFNTTSIMWGLTLGLLSLITIKSEKLKVFYKIIIVLLCCLLSLVSTYDLLPVLWIIVFGVYKDDKKLQFTLFSIVALFCGFSAIIPSILLNGIYEFYRIGIFLSIPLILMYDGTRGKKSNFYKYGFYVFYPLHHLVLYLIVIILSQVKL